MTRAILIYFLRREGQRTWLPSHLTYRSYSSTSLEEKGRCHAYFPTFLLEEGWGLAWGHPPPLSKERRGATKELSSILNSNNSQEQISRGEGMATFLPFILEMRWGWP